MIRLESRPSPAAVDRLTHLEQRRRELVSAGKELPNIVANGYREPVVKASIVAETYGKCAYCESKITHVYWGDVEHIIPKSKNPDGLLDYNNLTFACSICNGNKSDYHDPAMPLLNPYIDDLDLHILALGPFVWHRPADNHAETTIVLLKLNRPELVERRQRRLTDISRLADKYAALPEGVLRAAVHDQLCQEVESTGEFAFIIRNYLAQAGIDIDTT